MPSAPRTEDKMDVRYRLKHYNGDTHAEFMTANAALACQVGIDSDPDPRVKTWFHFEDADGKTVTLAARQAHPGHAYAILAALDSPRSDPSTMARREI